MYLSISIQYPLHKTFYLLLLPTFQLLSPCQKE
uniref:Uncharacterized protein n=1 Tax=Podoviridae sp. ct8Lf7 TaxID=2827723 RepID=A0A8S5S0W7_9CAUD|nr:MAG TPA: hypothetical protein [Podoviridae sp. ct8Lf7]